jgi:hypothetical protein
MAEDKKKRAMDIIVEFGKAPKGEEVEGEEGEGDDMVGLEQAMTELSAALTAGDSAAAAAAFKAAIELC